MRYVHFLLFCALVMLVWHAAGSEVPDTPTGVYPSEKNVEAAASTAALAETRLAPSGSTQEKPVISGDYVVWQDFRNGNWDIYMYDLKAKKEVQVTSGTATQGYPSVSRGKIAYHQGQGGFDWDVFVYDIKSATTFQVTHDPSEQDYPSISGDYVVWPDKRSGDWDIYMYDLKAKKETLIATGPETQGRPVIDGTRVVYQQDNGDDNWDVYLYDIRTKQTTQITTDPFKQTNPRISGNTIVWMDERNTGYDVYMYTIATGTESLVAGGSRAQAWPSVSGNTVVYHQDNTNDNWDIYQADIKTGQTVQVTTDSHRQEYPAIDGKRIVWQDDRSSRWNVYLGATKSYSAASPAQVPGTTPAPSATTRTAVTPPRATIIPTVLPVVARTTQASQGSTGMVQLDLPWVSLEYPAGWDPHDLSDASTHNLAMLSADKACFVYISINKTEYVPLDSLTDAFLDVYKNSQPGYMFVGREKSTFQGQPAMLFIFTTTSTEGVTKQVFNILSYKDSKLVFIYCKAPETSFDTYFIPFLQLLDTLQFHDGATPAVATTAARITPLPLTRVAGTITVKTTVARVTTKKPTVTPRVTASPSAGGVPLSFTGPYFSFSYPAGCTVQAKSKASANQVSIVKGRSWVLLFRKPTSSSDLVALTDALIKEYNPYKDFQLLERGQATLLGQDATRLVIQYTESYNAPRKSMILTTVVNNEQVIVGFNADPGMYDSDLPFARDLIASVKLA
jgi:beta propeller repeat protein